MKRLSIICLIGITGPACSGDGSGAETTAGPTTTTTTTDATATDSDTSGSGGTTTSATGVTTTTTDTDGGTTGASGGTTTGSIFIEEPDGGAGSIECDIWAQDCTAGEKCMPWANDGGNSWNATKCSPVDPNPKQPGDTCTVEGSGVSGVDDCDIGAMCWDVDNETAMGYCVDFCKGSEASPMCDNPNTTCSIYNDGVLPLCLPNCDPLLQDCPNMNVCVQAAGGESFVCVLDASGDAGAAGDPCEYVNVCDPGLFCANADAVPNCQGSIGCCSEFCDLSAADPDAACTCAAGGCACTAWFEMGMAPPGYEDVGVCVIPA